MHPERAVTHLIAVCVPLSTCWAYILIARLCSRSSVLIIA